MIEDSNFEEYMSEEDKEPNLIKELKKAEPSIEEPVLMPATAVAIVGSILGATVFFGINIDEKARGGILVFGMFFIPFIAGLWARRKAWSPASVIKLANQIVAKK